MFDKAYYEDRRKKLIQKAQVLQNEYLNSAFRFTNEMKEIEVEVGKINEWIEANKEEDKVIDKKAPKK